MKRVRWHVGMAVVGFAALAGSAAAQDEAVLEILNRAIDAMGGRAALEAIDGAVYEVVSQDGRIDEMHFLRAADEHVHIAWSPGVEGHRGRVGDIAWLQNANAQGSLLVELMSADEAIGFAQSFHRIVLDLLPLAESAHVAGQLVMQDAQATEIVFDVGENRLRRVLFCEKSGLPLQMAIEFVGRGRLLSYTFDQWQQQGAIVLFTRLTARQPARVTATFRALPDEAFEPPPAVKELLALRERAAADELRRAEVGNMTREEAVDELRQIAQEGVAARGTLRQAELRRDFARLMNRMRELHAGDEPGDEEEAFVMPERRPNMTEGELREALRVVARERQRAMQRGDQEAQKLLREEFDWLMSQVRNRGRER